MTVIISSTTRRWDSTGGAQVDCQISNGCTSSSATSAASSSASSAGASAATTNHWPDFQTFPSSSLLRCVLNRSPTKKQKQKQTNNNNNNNRPSQTSITWNSSIGARRAEKANSTESKSIQVNSIIQSSPITIDSYCQPRSSC